MAIKGKKKGQARGSQGQRRPATAPRPTSSYVPRRKVAWYQTSLGRGVAIVFGLVAVGVIWYVVSQAQTRAQELEERQEAVEEYTGTVRSALQPLADTVAQMGQVPPSADERVLAEVKKNVKAWNRALDQGDAALAGLFPPEGVTPINALFVQGIGLFGTAAETYGLAADAEGGETVTALMQQAGELRDRANAVIAGAIGALDSLRAELELDPSGLQDPAEAAQPQQTALPTSLPTSLTTIQPTALPTGGGAGEDGGDGGGGTGDEGGKGKG